MHSLRLQMFLAIALVSFVGLAALGLFSLRTVTLQVEELGPHPQRVDIGRIKLLLDAAYRRNRSWAGIGPTLDTIGRAEHVRLVLVSKRSELIASSDPKLRAARFQLQPNGWLRITVGPGAGASSSNQQSEFSIRMQPVSVGDPSHDGALLYALPAEPSAFGAPPPRVHAVRAIWVAVLVVALFATIAALALSSQILRPIDALTRAADHMSHGSFDARVSTKRKDEIGALAQAFNTMAENLQTTERLRKEMVADVAHELRTPLTHLTGRLEAIADGHMPLTPSVIVQIGDDVSLLTRLVGDLQDLALADAGQLHIAPQPTDLRDVIEGAVASYGSGHAPIAVDVPSPFPRVLADPARLNQIMRNLLSNALTHVAADGKVAVTATTDNRSARVTVHNDGPPLSDADLQLVFERFYRADKSRSRLTGGAGLGLAIVKQLVEAHGGNVWAENARPSGVSVSFTLPLAEPSS